MQYAKATYLERWYIPLSKDYTLYLRSDYGYGVGFNGKPLPTFKVFYAGGIGSVRGYNTNTIGPRDVDGSILGGDKRVTASVEVQFPFPGMAKDRSVRLTTFVDGGEVFGTGGGPWIPGPRFSTGFGVIWNSPFGPLAISYAVPLNKKEFDDIQHLQFTVGTLF